MPNLVGKLTDVSGEADFDFDRVSVNNVQGLFSKGKIKVAGEIPIFTSKNIQINNPLSVNLEQLLLNIKGLYKGNASGNLVITGSALQPLIGGDIALSNGQVLLTKSSTGRGRLERAKEKCEKSLFRMVALERKLQQKHPAEIPIR